MCHIIKPENRRGETIEEVTLVPGKVFKALPKNKDQCTSWSLMKGKGKKKQEESQARSCGKRGIKMKLDIKTEQK